jgi:hypothetical protein
MLSRARRAGCRVGFGAAPNVCGAVPLSCSGRQAPAGLICVGAALRAAWTILSISPSACSELSPSRTTATSGRSRAVHGAHVFDFDLAGQRLVAKRADDRGGGSYARWRSGRVDTRSRGSSSATQAKESLDRARRCTTITDSIVVGCTMSVSSPQRLGVRSCSGFSSRPMLVTLTVAAGGNARVRSRAPVSFHRSADLHRGTGVDGALASAAASGQARPAASICCLISERTSAHPAAHAHQPLRERR